MTFAEICLLIASGVGIYLLLTPFQRWLERHLISAWVGRRSRFPPTTIDVTDFTSYQSPRKDDGPT
jgi:hypothetical protein